MNNKNIVVCLQFYQNLYARGSKEPIGIAAQVQTHVMQEKGIVIMTLVVWETSNVDITIVKLISHMVEVDGTAQVIVVLVSKLYIDNIFKQIYKFNGTNGNI